MVPKQFNEHYVLFMPSIAILFSVMLVQKSTNLYQSVEASQITELRIPRISR